MSLPIFNRKPDALTQAEPRPPGFSRSSRTEALGGLTAAVRDPGPGLSARRRLAAGGDGAPRRAPAPRGTRARGRAAAGSRRLPDAPAPVPPASPRPSACGLGRAGPASGGALQRPPGTDSRATASAAAPGARGPRAEAQILAAGRPRMVAATPIALRSRPTGPGRRRSPAVAG